MYQNVLPRTKSQVQCTINALFEGALYMFVCSYCCILCRCGMGLTRVVFTAVMGMGLTRVVLTAVMGMGLTRVVFTAVMGMGLTRVVLTAVMGMGLTRVVLTAVMGMGLTRVVFTAVMGMGLTRVVFTAVMGMGLTRVVLTAVMGMHSLSLQKEMKERIFLKTSSANLTTQYGKLLLLQSQLHCTCAPCWA